MRFYKYIFILPFLCWAFGVRAQDQAPEQMPVPEQWQLTLDGIKNKAQGLMVETNGLQVEYRQLKEQLQVLSQSIADQQYKNDQLNRFIKERHGQTDQQVRIGELTQIIKTKRPQANVLEGQLRNFERKQSGMDRKIQLLKYTISDIELHQQAEEQKTPLVQKTVQPPAVDSQLTQLRKELEDESRQEVILENELRDLKTGGQTQNLNEDAIEAENKQLEAHLDVLRIQNLQREKESSDAIQAQANAGKYEELKKRKNQLEADINAYELRLDELKENSLMAISWPLKRKKLVHEMVQADARNNQMRDKIKVLREDIDVLKDQVAKLERRINFMKGQAIKQ